MFILYTILFQLFIMKWDEVHISILALNRLFIFLVLEYFLILFYNIIFVNIYIFFRFN